ncbi:MAG TPA: 5-dehydro-2-deoxygluconokinase [Arachnia sp.]|nr:5-dehydro-2-deoxygluconokinase [Arachnia sp.]HMT86599.1 5-dehydro-2-deoxygluconokinase [Arachnia sp.]
MDGSRARDVLAVGRCGVDLYPLQSGVRLEDVTTFGKFLGGSATNVAVACARYGRDVAVLTGVGDDPFGRFVVSELRRLGVDASHVVTNDDFNTPVAFCEIFPPDDFPLYFYRQPTTPDLELRPEDLPEDLERSTILWLTVSGLAVEPSRATHQAALARHPDGLTVLDLDYRPRFWPDEQTASRVVAEALEKVDVAIGNLEECRIAVGETDPERAADALLDRGVQIAFVKQGMTGTLAKSRTESTFVPSFPIDVVNGLGAGDAFGGAVCHGLLNGWDIERIVAFASAAGALVASRLECSTAMPYQSEVEELLARNGWHDGRPPRGRP